MMSDTRPDRPTGARAAALLLALLYGLVAGSAFAPLASPARAKVVSVTLDGHPGVAVAAKSGATILKAQRPAPGPWLLPTLSAVETVGTLRPASQAFARPAAAPLALASAPYRARAPPVA